MIKRKLLQLPFPVHCILKMTNIQCLNTISTDFDELNVVWAEYVFGHMYSCMKITLNIHWHNYQGHKLNTCLQPPCILVLTLLEEWFMKSYYAISWLPWFFCHHIKWWNKRNARSSLSFNSLWYNEYERP